MRSRCQWPDAVRWRGIVSMSRELAHTKRSRRASRHRRVATRLSSSRCEPKLLRTRRPARAGELLRAAAISRLEMCTCASSNWRWRPQQAPAGCSCVRQAVARSRTLDLAAEITAGSGKPARVSRLAIPPSGGKPPDAVQRRPTHLMRRHRTPGRSHHREVRSWERRSASQPVRCRVSPVRRLTESCSADPSLLVEWIAPLVR